MQKKENNNIRELKVRDLHYPSSTHGHVIKPLNIYQHIKKVKERITLSYTLKTFDLGLRLTINKNCKDTEDKHPLIDLLHISWKSF